MKGSKCLLLLAAFLVGFGVVGNAGAATITSLEVTSPDSGALKGIDSTFVVTAKVFDLTPVDSLEIVMYLASTNDSTVVADTSNTSVVWNSRTQHTIILIARDKNTGTGAGAGLRDGGSGSRIGSAEHTSLVAVQQKRNRRTLTSNKSDGTGFLGDADSVVVTISGDTTIFRWHGKVHASSGVVNGVRAAAFVIDDNSTSGSSSPPTWPANFSQSEDTSAVVLSAANRLFNIDADRPSSPSSLVDANAFLGTTVNVAGTNRSVLGIGDSVVVRSKLGAVANVVLLGDSLNVDLDVHNKVFRFNKGSRSADTLRINLSLTEGLFGDLNTSFGSGNADTLGVFVVDRAGNRSGASTTSRLDGPASGVTTAIQFLFDTKRPALDSTNGDTILPVSKDTITDGSLNVGFPVDRRSIKYKLAEALDTLTIAFSGASKLTLKVHAASQSTADSRLLINTERSVDFTQAGRIGPAAVDTFFVSDGTSGARGGGMTRGPSAPDTLLKTGVHSITFTGQDLAGNVGPALTRTDVYVDVDDIQLVRLFPTKAAFGAATAARIDTIERTTSQVIFRLSEPADSVLITYKGITGPDAGKDRTRRLSGTQLTNTAAEQQITIDSLRSGTLYQLSVLARDLAGNFTRSAPDTFLYDTAFVVPVIKRFVVNASAKGKLAASHRVAGQEVTLTVQADASTGGTRDAVTYKRQAILKVAGGRGVTLTGTGVTDHGGGRATLNADDWVTGRRSVVLKDTAGVDTLTVTVVDSTSAGGPFTGALDSAIVYDPDVFSQILVGAPDTVMQNSEFWVNLTLADKFKNARVLDNRYVSTSANKLGVMLPPGDVKVEKGKGGFWAKATMPAPDLVLMVKDILNNKTTPTSPTTAADVGGHQIDGMSKKIFVKGAASAALDAPDTLIAEDYMGADGKGDQGGFVMLTHDLSMDHGSLTGYRIYRAVQVTHRAATAADSTTKKLIKLTTPETAMIPWARVDAVPGVNVARVIVATLDNVASKWAVAAERGNQTTAKEAFDVAASVATPYELMARTMVESKKAAQLNPNAPVFAELSPEALAFVEQGVAPRFKTIDGEVLQSAMTITANAVRAIDNIAPEAVPFLRAMDTPADAGSSISVNWTKSESDRLLPRAAANAVGNGAISDMVAGVKGYNIYRKVGATGEYTLVGKAGAGETSFADGTALNGVRYTYKVAAYDEDNIAPAAMERTAMAIRNSVVDKNGKAIHGLFGMDNRVGFDDFFIFADHFGLTAADEAFEPAFDLAANRGTPKIDFDDFFVFADNFGRGIEVAGKVVPMMAGLNTDARLYLDAGAELPRIGEEVAVDVSLADFVELKGYGLTVNYDATKLEFVKAVAENSLLGEGELAQPRVIANKDGAVSIAAYGEAVSQGDLGLSLVFRTKAEIEETFIEVGESEVRDGNFAVNSVALPAAVQIQTRPENFALGNNYPNPFNPATTIKYALPEAAQVKLEVFNVVGQVVRTLVNDHQNAGRYTVQWDATNESGRSLSSGIYFYRLQAGGEFLEVKKMLLLK